MAESTLSLTRNDLRKAISNMLGTGIDLSSLDADQSTRIDLCVDIGCRNVYEPAIQPGDAQAHIWSFMQPRLTSFDINAPYSTGTVTIVAGVVTGSGTTFPSWAASAELSVGGASYTVASRGGDTSLTLDDTGVTAAAGSSYVLQQLDYTLPDLFGGFLGDLYLDNSDDTLGVTLQRIPYDGPGSILELRKGGVADYNAQPCHYAVVAEDQTGTGGQRWLLAIWPTADTAYTVSGRYIINPYQLTSTYTYPMGGLPLAECLRESCLAAAELEFKGEAGIHTAMFQQRLRTAISFDRQVSNPGNLGQNRDYSRERRRWMRIGPRTEHVGLGATSYTGYP